MSTSSWLAALALRELRPGTWTLEVIEELCARLGHPERGLPAIHVAGTRGKGSTCALIESVLRGAGFSTGLTTSPHLVDPTERIRLGGKPVSEGELVRLAGVVREAGGEELRAGYFEVMTAAAFLAFAEAGVDVALVETGLGGRVDATNIVSPLVTAITRLGMDHADRLGGTLEAIASEKAGILKPGVRAVLGLNSAATEAVIAARADAIGAPLRIARPADVARAPATALAGRIGRENAAVAMLALEELAEARPRLRVGAEDVARGFASVTWRARLETVARAVGGRDLLLDVAHDVDGVAALLQEVGGRAVSSAIFSCLADKDLAGMAALMASSPGLSRAQVLVPCLSGPRARSASDVARALQAAGLSARAVPDVASALREAATIGDAAGLVLAFGSFQVAGPIVQALDG